MNLHSTGGHWLAQNDELARASWRVRWAARWRWLFRRWVFALTGLGVGLTGGWWLLLDRLHDYGHALQALQDVQQQLMALPQPRAVAAPVQPEALARLPVLGQQAATWLALQQVLALHRVSVLSLRPLQDLRTAPLPHQGVALRLQARFGDWVAAWLSLNHAGPVWAIERIRITPMAAGDALEIEAVLRVWMREGPEHNPAEAAWVQAARAQPSQGVGVAVFASPEVKERTSQTARMGEAREEGDERVSPQSPGFKPVLREKSSAQADGAPTALARERPPAGPLVFAPAPEHMPFAPWRLLGIWEHAGMAQAFLASGTHWFRVSAGQPISLEGHRLEAVAADRVVWRDPQGQLNTLTLESRTP
jgi:hypothetical protein